MQNYRKTSHSVYDLKYHLVWITKYRKPVLHGRVAERVRELIREICKANEVEILRGHIHIFVSVPPQIFSQQVDAEAKREDLTQDVGRVQRAKQEVLGQAHMG